MLSIQFIRENVDLVQENAKKKGLDLHKDIALLLEKDEAHRKILYEAEQLRRERNTITQEINTLKKAKKDATTQIKAAKEIPGKIKKTEEKVEKVQAQITALQSENASQQALIDTLQVTLAAISEFPAIRNLLDRIEQLESQP